MLVLHLRQALTVRQIDGRILLALGANVLVNAVRLRLHNADAPAVEPVLALVAANVELRLIVRLAAQTVQLLRVARMLAFAAHELGQRLRSILADADALAVEPIVAQIAAHIELGVIVRRPAQTEEFLFFARHHARFEAAAMRMRTSATAAAQTLAGRCASVIVRIVLVGSDGRFVCWNRSEKLNGFCFNSSPSQKLYVPLIIFTFVCLDWLASERSLQLVLALLLSHLLHLMQPVTLVLRLSSPSLSLHFPGWS